MLGPWRDANVSCGTFVQYCATFTVHGSPPTGSLTSKYFARAATFENGRCADSAGCSRPQRHDVASAPCMATMRSSALASALDDCSTQPALPHQACEFFASSTMVLSPARNVRLPYSAFSFSSPSFGPITALVNSSPQTASSNGAPLSARMLPSKSFTSASAAAACGWSLFVARSTGSSLAAGCDHVSAWT